MFLLWFDRITGFNPGFKAAQDWVGPVNAVLQHNQRRTGACVLSWSGAVGDIPCVWVQPTHKRFCLVDRGADCAGGMLRLKLGLTSGVH